MTPLCDIAFKYGSGKCPQIKLHNTEWYFKEFNDRRNSVKKVFEMGVGGGPGDLACYPNYTVGASLYMWRDFFPNAQIYGIDILPELVFKDDRIETFQCDQGDKKKLLGILNKIGTDFDLVVDDASHLTKHQISCCRTIMPLLKKGAVYVIEDVRGGKRNHILGHLKEYNCELIEPLSGIHFNDDRLFVMRK
jgi:hypothetical protein